MHGYGNFQLIYSGRYNGIIPIYKYKSSKTGLQIVYSQINGPLVDGYFCLATEAHDDDGLPHTLEHLVFMGSKKYPFKGVLDLFANRCLASGTNAWTDTDHTCYTMTTAGGQGFLNLLPIYLDHVLNPSLTKEGYTTEVHHINGEGEDAGVVYCEMQSSENTVFPILHRKVLELLYPNSGYQSETGGKLLNLRESTSHAKVCKYHKDFYIPENLCIIISGTIDMSRLFSILNDLEDTLPNKSGDFVRPWMSEVEPLTQSKQVKLKYPSDCEDHGEIIAAWRIGSCEDHKKMAAVHILLDYLTDTSVSPLQRTFVESDDAFCANVTYSIIENSESCMTLNFKSIEKRYLDSVKDKLFELFKDIHEGREKIEMQRITDLLNNSRKAILSSIENNANEAVASQFIGDFLYSKNNSQTEVRMNQDVTLKELLTEDVSYWLNLFNSILYEQNYVFVIGEASIELMTKMGKDEESRVQNQRDQLGEEKLTAKAKTLTDAISTNDIATPDEMIRSVSVPDVSLVKFHPLSTSTNNGSASKEDNHLNDVVNKMPIQFQLDDISSNFVNIVSLLDGSKLDARFNEFIPLFTELLLESPLLKDAVVVDHVDVIKHIAAVTMVNSCNQGLSGYRFTVGKFPEFTTLEVMCAKDDYEKVVTLVSDLLYNLVVSPARIRVVASKMLKSAQTSKEKGNHVLKTLMKTMLFKKNSKIVTSLMTHQCEFLSKLLEDLASDEKSGKVIDTLKTISKELGHNLRVHVSTDVKAMQEFTELKGRKIQDIWNEKFPNLASSPRDEVIERTLTYLKDNLSDSKSIYVVGVGSVESAYFLQSTKSISDFQNVKDIARINVFLQYLTQLEGPLWRSIRGQGLAYHYNISLQVESGILTILLSQATHVAKAYKVLKEIIMSYLNEEVAFNELEFESCKSSLIYEMITKEKTIADASHQSLISYLSHSSHSYNKEILKEIATVKVSDMKAIGKKYIAPLFDTSISKVALVCNPAKVNDIMADFKKFGLDFEKLDGVEDKFFKGN